jgi:hypothetical protein
MLVVQENAVTDENFMLCMYRPQTQTVLPPLHVAFCISSYRSWSFAKSVTRAYSSTTLLHTGLQLTCLTLLPNCHCPAICCHTVSLMVHQGVAAIPLAVASSQPPQHPAAHNLWLASTASTWLSAGAPSAARAVNSGAARCRCMACRLK